MKESKKCYYQIYLEVALRTESDVFGFINISHIPYSKFEEVFMNQAKEYNQKYLFDDSVGYSIDERLYHEYKDFFDAEVPFKFDFSLFEYSVSMAGDTMDKYKKDYYEELPPTFGH